MSYQLSTRFGRNSYSLRSDTPLTDEQMRNVAPSIFAEDKAASRSDRYTYIPTGDVITKLRQEGFQPFSVCQSKTRDKDQRDYTKHMIRLRHASQINASSANEIALINSHNGASSYQLISGVFRFACSNGLIFGDVTNDIRVRHTGDVMDNVIDGAFRVLEDFEKVDAQRESMQALTLNPGEQAAFANAALSLRYDTETAPAPVTEAQILQPRRPADTDSSLWTTLNVTQENLIRGGLRGRNATGRRANTREVQGIDQNIKLNRALWLLAEGMKKLKA